jgi:hypothetical protein
MAVEAAATASAVAAAKTVGEGGGDNLSTDSFGNKGDRQWQGQTTINQKNSEMAVKAAAMVGAVAEAKIAAEGRQQRWRQQLWQ